MKAKRTAIWAPVQIMAIATLLFAPPGIAQDTAISGEEAFRQALELLDANEHEKAIPLLEVALEEHPESRGALWNLGTSALITERYDLATTIWSRYRALEPDDWQALPKLVQAHQGSGNC